MALDTGGNQAVDFVWGNMPMQPDTGRGTVLDKTLDSHNIAGYGYNGFPGFVANGGVVVPALTTLAYNTTTTAAVTNALSAVGLVLGTVTGTLGAATTVTAQGTAAGTHVPLKTAVNITIA